MAKKNVTSNRDPDAMAEERTPEQIEALARLEKLIAEQGIKPLTFEDLLEMGKVWPDDEDVDDFIAAVQEWRSEGGERELP